MICTMLYVYFYFTLLVRYHVRGLTCTKIMNDCGTYITYAPHIKVCTHHIVYVLIYIVSFIICVCAHTTCRYIFRKGAYSHVDARTGSTVYYYIIAILYTSLIC